MEKISVIVPVYNVEKYLKRCVDSILAQTYTCFEIILVDDGSGDGSSSICDEYKTIDERVSVLHKKNGGLSSARNAGIELATGKYIYFIDSDDWISPVTFETLYNNIVRYDADVSDIDSIITSNEKTYQNGPEKIQIFEGENILVDYFLSDKYSCCRKLYKRDVIGKIRFPEGKINEDIATNYQFLSAAKREVKSSLKLYYYFRNPNSITGVVFRKRDFDLLDACENLVELSRDNLIIQRLAKIKLAISYYAIIGRYVAYECEQGYNPIEQINEIRKKLQESYKLLALSHISIKKKVLVTICVLFSPVFLKKIYRKAKAVK